MYDYAATGLSNDYKELVAYFQELLNVGNFHRDIPCILYYLYV